MTSLIIHPGTGTIINAAEVVVLVVSAGQTFDYDDDIVDLAQEYGVPLKAYGVPVAVTR